MRRPPVRVARSGSCAAASFTSASFAHQPDGANGNSADGLPGELLREECGRECTPGEIGLACELGNRAGKQRPLRAGVLQLADASRKSLAPIRSGEIVGEPRDGSRVELESKSRIAARREQEHGPSPRAPELRLVETHAPSREEGERGPRVTQIAGREAALHRVERPRDDFLGRVPLVIAPATRARLHAGIVLPPGRVLPRKGNRAGTVQTVCQGGSPPGCGPLSAPAVEALPVR
jgi:hypothetical protein